MASKTERNSSPPLHGTQPPITTDNSAGTNSQNSRISKVALAILVVSVVLAPFTLCGSLLVGCLVYLIYTHSCKKTTKTEQVRRQSQIPSTKPNSTPPQQERSQDLHPKQDIQSQAPQSQHQRQTPIQDSKPQIPQTQQPSLSQQNVTPAVQSQTLQSTKPQTQSVNSKPNLQNKSVPTSYKPQKEVEAQVRDALTFKEFLKRKNTDPDGTIKFHFCDQEVPSCRNIIKTLKNLKILAERGDIAWAQEGRGNTFSVKIVCNPNLSPNEDLTAWKNEKAKQDGMALVEFTTPIIKGLWPGAKWAQELIGKNYGHV